MEFRYRRNPIQICLNIFLSAAMTLAGQRNSATNGSNEGQPAKFAFANPKSFYLTPKKQEKLNEHGVHCFDPF